MLKYTNIELDNYLIPQESTIVITLCDAANKEGIPLFIRELQRILESYKNKATCVMFQGAEFKPALITYWVNYVFKHFKTFKNGWISNEYSVPSCLPLHKMDYMLLDNRLFQRDYLNTKDKSFKKTWYEKEEQRNPQGC